MIYPRFDNPVAFFTPKALHPRARVASEASHPGFAIVVAQGSLGCNAFGVKNKKRANQLAPLAL